MTIKSERLERRIQEIQQFVNGRIERDQIFEVVSQKLTKIADTLKQEKLTIQIISPNPVSGQKLQNFLNSYDVLKKEYHFSPILQICDFNSTNDTYIYSQQLQKPQTSQSLGNRITLEYEKFYQQLAGCNILCLVIRPNQIYKIDQMQLIQQLNNTQISTLVVVIETSDVACESVLQVNPINDEVRAWFQEHSNCVQKIEIYSFHENELEKFCHSLKTLNKRRSEDIRNKHFTTLLLTQITLIEDFLIKKIKKLEVEDQQDKANLQIRGGDQFRRQFDETIKLISNDKASVVKEIKSKVNQSVIDLLDKFYCDSIICQIRNYVNELKPKIIKREGSHVYIKLVKTIKKANKYSVEPEKISNSYTEGGQNAFFQKTQQKPKLINYLLLSSYFWQSLFSKFINLNLTDPNKKNNPKYKIELIREDSVDANTVLTEYYRYTLSKWAAKEWENVCNSYAEGGLKRFFQTTYERVNLISRLDTETCFWQHSQSVDILQVFERSVDKPSCETSYVKNSLLSFIFSKIRNNLMPFLTISFALSILGIANRRQIARWTVQPVLSAFEYAPLLTIFIVIFVIYLLVKSLFQTYHKHSVAEMKKAEDKLKEDIYRFYSGLIQHLTEKIRQKLLLAIETEEQRLDENIHFFYRQLLEQINKAPEINQPLLKKQIEQRKEHLKYLNQELGELQKLKRRN